MTRARRPAWTDDETISVVAYLDHYVKKRKENGRFPDEDILSKITSHIKSRSSSQIRGKIYALWGGSCTAVARNRFQNVLKFGSRCLKSLPDRLRPKIRELMKVIEFDEESEQIYTPQTLRNGKERSMSNEPRWQRSRRSMSGTETPAKQMSNELRKVALRQRSTAVEKLKEEADEDTSRLNSNSDSDGCADVASGVKTDGDDHRNVLLEVADSVASSPLSDLDTSRGSEYDQEIELSSRRLFALDDVVLTPMVDDDRDVDERLPTQNSTTDRVYEVLRDLLEDNRYLRKKHTEMKNENMQLSLQNRVLSRRLPNIENNVSISQSQTMITQNRKIEELKRSIKLQETVLPFMRHSTSNTGPSNFKQVKAAFDDLTSDIQCLAKLEWFICDARSLYQSSSPTLGTLLQRSLPQESFSYVAGAKNSRSIHNGIGSKIVASLTAAAVCEWIFLSNTSCAILLSTPLHEGYRRVLRAGCGEQTVRNLDVLVHQEILRDKDFQQIYVNQTAEKYLTKFFEVLCNIVNGNMTAKHNIEAKQCIRSAFVHAQILKYELLLRQEKFKINWPAPDSMHEEAKMNMFETDTTQGAHTINKNGILVRNLTLVPGLQGYLHNKDRIHDVIFTVNGDFNTDTPSWTLQGTVDVI